MKTIRTFLFLMVAALVLLPTASAQDAQTKAKLAEIRKAYANAMKLEEQGKKGPNYNYQTFRWFQSDPNGNWEKKIDFIVDPSGYVEELDLYYSILMFVRQTINKNNVQEFLFDEDGELLFVFTREIYEEDGPIVEERYYYGKEGSFWKIVKNLDRKTGKVLKETAEPTEAADGTAMFLHRVGNDLYEAFGALNVMYD